MNIRIIPRLDIKGPNLVKGVHFEGLRVLGRPEAAARYYAAQGADELIYIDAVASLYGRNSLDDIVRRTAEEVFIPLTVGGGLRTVQDIERVLKAGADKVAINSAALRRPEIIREASERFGSSTIVISVEAMRHPDGRCEAYADYGRECTGRDAVEWALRAEELGCGELLVTSVNQDGTGKGLDLALTRAIATSVSIPVIASGGVGCLGHAWQAIEQGRADAVCMASILHYRFVKDDQVRPEDIRGEGNVEFLTAGRGVSMVQDASIGEIKAYLVERGVDCRVAE